MSPEQQSALQAVVGRELTPDELMQVEPHIQYNSRNDVAIAAILSVGRTKLVSRNIGPGDIIDAIGFESGNVLLDEVYSNPMFRHIKPELVDRNLDISRPLTISSLDMLVQAGLPGFTQAHADILKSLAIAPDPINFNVVSDALNIAEGRVTL